MAKRRWLVVLALAALLTSLPTLIYAQAANYYTSVIMSDVVSGAPVVGGVFTTYLSLSVVNTVTPAVGIMGADIWLQFDDLVVGVDDADDNAVNGVQVEVLTEFFGGSIVVAANEVTTCPGGGTCVHLALSHTGTPITSRTGRIAKITWAGLTAGNAGFAVAADSVLADADGIEIPINSSVIPTITVMVPGFINGTVLRQGTRTSHAGSIVVAYNTSGGVVAAAPTAPDGTFSLTVPLGGSYLVQATYNGYLKAQRTNVYVVGATVNIGTTTLLGGDVNYAADNNINILDIVTIINFYGSTGLAASDPRDINDDGSVNIFDLTIAAGNFGRFAPTPW